MKEKCVMRILSKGSLITVYQEPGNWVSMDSYDRIHRCCSVVTKPTLYTNNNHEFGSKIIIHCMQGSLKIKNQLHSTGKQKNVLRISHFQHPQPTSGEKDWTGDLGRPSPVPHPHSPQLGRRVFMPAVNSEKVARPNYLF